MSSGNLVTCTLGSCGRAFQGKAFLEHVNRSHREWKDLGKISLLAGCEVQRCGLCQLIVQESERENHLVVAHGGSPGASPIERLVSQHTTPKTSGYMRERVRCPLCKQPCHMERRSFLAHVNSNHADCSDLSVVSAARGCVVERCTRCGIILSQPAMQTHLATYHGIGAPSAKDVAGGDEDIAAVNVNLNADFEPSPVPALPPPTPPPTPTSGRPPPLAIDTGHPPPMPAPAETSRGSGEGTVRSLFTRFFVALGIVRVVEVLVERVRSIMASFQSSVPALPAFSPYSRAANPASPSSPEDQSASAGPASSSLASVWRLTEALGTDGDDEEANKVAIGEDQGYLGDEQRRYERTAKEPPPAACCCTVS